MLSEKSLVGRKNSVLRWDGEEVEDGSGGGSGMIPQKSYSTGVGQELMGRIIALNDFHD